MSEPYLAEVKMFGFNFPPRGWAMCDGQILPINQNQALFSLLGTTFGGNGTSNFALPDLRGRTPIHPGSNGGLNVASEGERGGEERHVLTVQEMPLHRHGLQASDVAADGDEPDGSVLPGHTEQDNPIYGQATAGNLVNMRNDSIANNGGNQSHNNMQPYLVVNFCIALQGLFPPRN